MIDERVNVAGREFARFWSDVFASHPRYQLDYSWPSVGVLGVLVSQLRGKTRLSENDRILLFGAAAYLALIAEQVWAPIFKGLNLTVDFDEYSPDIIVRVTSGRAAGREDLFTLPLLSSLRTITTSPQNPFPIFERGERTLFPGANVVPAFAGAMLSGLSPFASGTWPASRIEDMQKLILPVAERLAKTCAAYYTKLFPSEPLGSESNLYLPNLVLPPMGYNEPHLAIRGTAGMVEYARTVQAEESTVRQAGLNLSSMCDELLSSVGFAIAVALCDDAPPPRLVAQAMSKGAACPALRPAVMLARLAFGRKSSWVDHLREKDIDAARAGLLTEQSLNFLPLLYLEDLQALKDPLLTDFFDLLSWSQLKQAREYIERYLDHRRPGPDMQLQAAYLFLISGDQDRAAEMLKQLDAGNQGPNIRCRILDLRGLAAEASGDPEQAAILFQGALEVPNGAFRRRPALQEWLGRYHGFRRHYAAGVQYFEQALAANPQLCGAASGQISLLTATGKEEDAARVLDRVLNLAPNDPALINLLAHRLVNPPL